VRAVHGRAFSRASLILFSPLKKYAQVDNDLCNTGSGLFQLVTNVVEGHVMLSFFRNFFVVAS